MDQEPPEQDPAQRVTLADVARDCGVSAMTVSNVVRGIQCVNSSTKARVEASLKKLGYRSEPMLRALATYRTQKTKRTPVYRTTVAFLQSEWDDFTDALFTFAQQEAAQWGYKMEAVALPEAPEKQRALSRRLWMQGVQGALVGPCFRGEILNGFEKKHFTLVGINTIQHGVTFDTVGMDYFQGLYLAARKCYERGMRRIGLLLSDALDTRTGHRWSGAYYAFCEHHGIPRIDFIIGADDRKMTYQQVAQRFSTQGVEAVLTTTAFHMFEERLPGVRFVALNDWMPRPGWWYIRTPRDLMAREAVRQLDYRLCHRNLGDQDEIRNISVNGTWVEQVEG